MKQDQLTLLSSEPRFTATTFKHNAFRFLAARDWNTQQNTLKLTPLVPVYFLHCL